MKGPTISRATPSPDLRPTLAAGRQVRKGERSTPIVAVGVATDKKTGAAKTFARTSRVFHRDQTDPIEAGAAPAADVEGRE